MGFRSALRAVSANVTDAKAMGPRFLSWHFGRLSRQKFWPVHIKGFGRLFIRLHGQSDLEVLRGIFKGKEWGVAYPAFEKTVEARYSKILDAGKVPVIIDAGANIGASARWFKTVYPAAHVVALEPDPHNFALLKQNSEGIEIIEAAIGAVSGRVELNYGTLGWDTHTTRSRDGVPVLTVQEVLASVSNGTLFLVKIDIEGFESDLFSQNLGWLDEVFVVCVEPHDWLRPGQQLSKNFQKAFGDRNFELLINGSNLIYVRSDC
jgi:FkbM family methyltransferase